MSDTPRTDAVMAAFIWRPGKIFDADGEMADFARQLERENAALKIERNRYKVALQDIADASGEWAGDKARDVLGKEGQL